MGDKRIVDRGQTRGHRFLVAEAINGKRLAAFDTKEQAEAFVGGPKLKLLKGGKKK